MDTADRYTYRVVWSDEDQEYVGTVAELPSLSWLAADSTEALVGIRRLAADVVKDMEAAGETPPLPLHDRHYSGKVQVRIPPEIHRRLALEAAEDHISLNRLIAARLA